MRTQVSSVETSRVYMETDYKQKYDTIMKDKLQELRDEFEEEAENVKKDVENTYKLKVLLLLLLSDFAGKCQSCCSCICCLCADSTRKSAKLAKMRISHIATQSKSLAVLNHRIAECCICCS